MVGTNKPGCPSRPIVSACSCPTELISTSLDCFLPLVQPNQSPSTDILICFTELVLTLNNFSFNFSHFPQTKGVAMGTHMGPSYACLFVGYV
eukprot:g23050.t1